MSVSSESGSSTPRTRGRSSSNGSSGSAEARGATRGRRPSSSSSKPKTSSGAKAASRTSSRSRAASARSASTGARGKAADKAKQATRAAENAASNGAGELLSVPAAITNVGVPVVTAALGIAGGVVLGRTALKRNRKVMGISIPNTKIDFAGVSKQVGEAGRQFGNLAREVRMVREKAEKVGKAIG